MKIQHAFKGKGPRCAQCDSPKRMHRIHKARKDVRPEASRTVFIGLDGEGQTDANGKHRYVMLCAASEKGETWATENERGLSTVESLEFLLSLPLYHAKVFTYSFGYDLTKVLEDVDDLTLYRLLRPELRRRERDGRVLYMPVDWQAPTGTWYRFAWMNGQFTVRRALGRKKKKLVFGKKGRVIYDVWRFFGGKFTEALSSWKVPGGLSESERAHYIQRMREMKDRRAHFDKLTREEVRAYCFDECRSMAELARKLTEAHVTAGIPLKKYYGAGSSASAMFEAMHVESSSLPVMSTRDYMHESRETPEVIASVIMRAFFGGRFENSVLGPVDGPVYSYDISSAYPYALCFLPCLLHGRWEKTAARADLERCTTAVVRYALQKPSERRTWAPFPFRLRDGTITFPEESGGGWIWRDEYLAGEKLFPNVRFVEAWTYYTDCNCRPFADVPRFYRERLRIGKEGPGIVLKLGTNSIYGKTAQMIGGQPGEFTSFMWAGLITSTCRALVLDALGCHQDQENLLMVATDGIASRERLTLPGPRETGTGDCLNEKGEPARKPLGGWEEKVIAKGLFLARPGIYFPMHPTKEDLEKVRGRGVGRAAIYDHWAHIVDSWRKHRDVGDLKKAVVPIKELRRFVGAKTGISRSGTVGAYKYKRSKDFGRWITLPIGMSFNPNPKREGIDAEGRLGLKRFPDDESVPYRKGLVSPEARALKDQADMMADQPDVDVSDWEEGDE